MKDHYENCCDEYAGMSRRRFLGRTSATAAALASAPTWLPKIAYGGSRGTGTADDVFVYVFLRGGMDGMTTVVPYADQEIYNLRPTIAIQPPGQTDGAIDLDGFFGLAPAAAPLLTPWSNGHLAVVHAAGSTDPTRSHFDAMKFIETATPNQPASDVVSGWLGRHLQTIAPIGTGDFRGIALDSIVPRTLAQAPATLPIPDPGDFDFPGNAMTAAARRAAIDTMYQGAVQPLSGAAASSLATIDILAAIDFDNYVPANGAVYPTTEFGQAFRSTAALIKAGVGVEVAEIDIGGWDHHNQLGPINGIMAQLLDQLTRTLEAFYLDMQGQVGDYTLVVQSEFGRRAFENGSAGLDHGHGNAMLVMGGNVNGGQVHGTWPGLDAGSLDNGDLAVTTDYRDVLSEIVSLRLANDANLGYIFPNHTPTFPGIVV